MIQAVFRVRGTVERAQALVDRAHRGYVGLHPQIKEPIIYVKFRDNEEYRLWRATV